MSRFYAEIQGNRGLASRMGNKESGIYGHIRGWDIGVRVSCYVNDFGEDVVAIDITGGSNNPGIIKSMGNFTKKQVSEVKNDPGKNR